MNHTLWLSWDAYRNNICSGLSILQQRGEFVDMTLAADGHHVKVHQMVLALVSPYIKALISTAQCPHPIIFLNDISYGTLCLILEYIYTGEVNVPRDKLKDLLKAGEALHIKGLREMNDTMEIEMGTDTGNLGKENKKQDVNLKETKKPEEKMCEVFGEVVNDSCEEEISESPDILNVDVIQNNEDADNSAKHSSKQKKGKRNSTSIVNYSMSNQGNLQLIFNRYIYNLKYVQKNRVKYWRCVNYAYKKCPANIYTNEDNVVLKRRCPHNHPFHDAIILKKHHLNILFECFKEAQDQVEQKKAKDTIELARTRTHSAASDDSE